MQALNSQLLENSGFSLSIRESSIFLKRKTEDNMSDVLIHKSNVDDDILQLRNLRDVVLYYVRFTSEQSESLGLGNFFPPILQSLVMKTADFDIDGSEIPNGNPWICLNQLEHLQILDLVNCAVVLTDVPLPMRLKSLALQNVSFQRNGEMMSELILNEFINFCCLKSLSLTCHGIEENETGRKQLWVVDMTGNLNLDSVKLIGNSVVCKNWEDANWTIDHLILNNVELKSSKIETKHLEMLTSTVELSDLPSTIQSLALDSGVSFVKSPQDCFLQNLKYIEIRTPFSLKSDILGLLKKCPTLVGLKFENHFNKEFDLSDLPSTVRELNLNGVHITGDQVRHVDILVLQRYMIEDARLILTKLRPQHLCYNQIIIINPGNDTKLVDLIQCQFKLIALGPITWRNFKTCELSSYVDEEGSFYIFQNQRGTSIDLSEFSALSKFPPIERCYSFKVSMIRSLSHQ